MVTLVSNQYQAYNNCEIYNSLCLKCILCGGSEGEWKEDLIYVAGGLPNHAINCHKLVPSPSVYLFKAVFFTQSIYFDNT